MSHIRHPRKACTVNPLKASAPLGAALAYLGMEGAVPLLHGSQGCTSFALVAAVRHFKEAIPLQTTALDEITTILGAAGNLEEALVNLQQRMKPRLIGIATTALTETCGADIAGELRLILEKRKDLAATRIALASTPDYDGALEDGWSKAVAALIDTLVLPDEKPRPLASQVNLLPGVHQTSGDIEELIDLVESFGLTPFVLPDISRSLDGTVPDAYTPTSFGGASLEGAATMGRAIHSIAIGEHMRRPAELLHERTGVAFSLFPSLTGLEPTDRLVALLTSLSGQAAPPRLRRERSRLVDAMLDGHFHLGGRRVAIASDPDLLCGLATFFASMGAEIVAAVASTDHSPLLATLPAAEVMVGDLGDLEAAAREADAELLVTHSHGRQAAARLGVPLLRVGFPIFDRLGSTHRCSVGYRGTRELIFEVANLVLAQQDAHGPGHGAADPVACEGGTHGCPQHATH